MLQPSVDKCFVSRAKTVTIPEPWAIPPEMKEKFHLLYKKSEFVEKSIKHFSSK